MLEYLATSGALDRGLKVRPMHFPDIFIEHDKPEKMYELAGLNAGAMVEAALAAMGMHNEIAELVASRAPAPKLV